MAYHLKNGLEAQIVSAENIYPCIKNLLPLYCSAAHAQCSDPLGRLGLLYLGCRQTGTANALLAFRVAQRGQRYFSDLQANVVANVIYR